MRCIACGKTSLDEAYFCMYCGKSFHSRAPRISSAFLEEEIKQLRWTDTVAVAGLFILGIVGIYLHPYLEVAMASYVAVGVSAIWVFMDAPKQGFNRWGWTIAMLALWFFTLPIYLFKTRFWRGLIPGICVVVVVAVLQFFPEIYSAKKHFKRGVIFASQQRLSQAEEEFRASLRQDNTLGEAHLNLGIVYFTQGMLEAAERELRIALDLIRLQGVRLIAGGKEEALVLCLSHLSAVYAMRASESIQVLNKKEAARYYKQAQTYASEAMIIDKDNVRSQELARRLDQLGALLE